MSQPFSSSKLFVYDEQGTYRPANTEEVLQAARRALGAKLRRGVTLSSPRAVADYLKVTIGALDHEVFSVIFLDAQNRLLANRQMFRGTVTQTSVYPREIVKEALALNAAAAIIAHNHPSGSTDPSRADEQLTRTLKSTLELVDVRLLDHLIVTGTEALSFAERGLL